jgi:hypothetical protein
MELLQWETALKTRASVVAARRSVVAKWSFMVDARVIAGKKRIVVGQ